MSYNEAFVKIFKGVREEKIKKKSCEPLWLHFGVASFRNIVPLPFCWVNEGCDLKYHWWLNDFNFSVGVISLTFLRTFFRNNGPFAWSWNKIFPAGWQATHWGIQNKDKSRLVGGHRSVLEAVAFFCHPAWWILYHVTISCKEPTTSKY